MDPSMIGGIVGSLLGVAGGLLGTYLSIRNTRGPAERSFVIKAAVACWVAVSGLLVALTTFPDPYRTLVWIPYVFLLVLGVQRIQRIQQRIREQESS